MMINESFWTIAFAHWLTGITRCGNKEYVLVKYKMSFFPKSTKQIDVCGVVLPNIPLSNIILQETAKRLNINNFGGVFLGDELPERPRANECDILNLDDSRGSGTHLSRLDQAWQL